jgi:hypothetical protein
VAVAAAEKTRGARLDHNDVDVEESGDGNTCRACTRSAVDDNAAQTGTQQNAAAAVAVDPGGPRV